MARSPDRPVTRGTYLFAAPARKVPMASPERNEQRHAVDDDLVLRASTQVTRRKLRFDRRFVPRDRYTWMERALKARATGRAGPQRCHQPPQLAGRIEAEGVFAVLKNGIRRQLPANLQEFFRGTPFLIGSECGELAVDLVDSLEPLEIVERAGVACPPRTAWLVRSIAIRPRAFSSRQSNGPTLDGRVARADRDSSADRGATAGCVFHPREQPERARRARRAAWPSS